MRTITCFQPELIVMQALFQDLKINTRLISLSSVFLASKANFQPGKSKFVAMELTDLNWSRKEDLLLTELVTAKKLCCSATKLVDDHQ